MLLNDLVKLLQKSFITLVVEGLIFTSFGVTIFFVNIHLEEMGKELLLE